MHDKLKILIVSFILLGCEGKKDPIVAGDWSRRTCEFGSTRVHQYSLESTASVLGLNKDIGYGNPLNPPACWSFANGIVFFSKTPSVSAWAYGGWWDGKNWVNPYGALAMSLPAGDPVAGDGFFRKQRLGYGNEIQLSEEQNIPLSVKPDTVLPLPEHLAPTLSGPIDQLQMPPGLPYAGKHRLLFPGGAFEVDVESAGAFSGVAVRPPDEMNVAPDDTTIDTVAVQFVTDKTENYGFGIPFKLVTRIKSIPLFIELIDPDPSIPAPPWRFVASDQVVQLPRKTSWIVRGTCVQPLWVEDTVMAGKTISLEWQAATVQVEKTKNDALLSYFGNSTSSPIDYNFMVMDETRSKVGNALAGAIEDGDARVIPCDTGVEIENGSFTADLDLHVGGYLFSIPVASYVRWVPPLGWELDRPNWQLLPIPPAE